MASHAVEAGGTLPAPSGPASDAQAALEKDATVRDLMSPPVGVFHGTDTVAETIENLREQTKTAFITYCYLTDAQGRLEGLVVMREMLLAKPGDKLSDIKIDAFALREDMLPDWPEIATARLANSVSPRTRPTSVPAASTTG